MTGCCQIQVLRDRLKDLDTYILNQELEAKPRSLPGNEPVYGHPVRFKVWLCRKRLHPKQTWLSRPFEDNGVLSAFLELPGSSSGDGGTLVPLSQPEEAKGPFAVLFSLLIAIGALTSLALLGFLITSAISAGRKAELAVL